MNDNPKTPADEIGAKIDALTGEMVGKIAALSTASYIREGLMKHAMASVIWDFYHAFPDERYALAEILEGFDDVVKDAIDKDREEAKAAATPDPAK